MANLTGRGYFNKGQSGNPSGRSKVSNDFIHACEKHSLAALEVISNMMNNGKEESDRLRAAIWIAERAHGKASQSMNVENDGVIQPVLVIQEKR